MPKAVNTNGARAPKDESQKSEGPQYAVLAVRDSRSMFGAAEALMRSAGKIIKYTSFESASAAAAALNESVEVEAVSYRVVDLTKGAK